MATTRHQKNLRMKLYGIATGLILFLIGVHATQAIFVSSPQDPLLTGDVTTIEILDGTILQQDIGVSKGVNFSALNIGTSTIGSLVATSSFLTASSTMGSTTIGTLNSTTTINMRDGNMTARGVAYVWPATQGAASTLLTNNGSGDLTWDPISFGAGTTTNSGTFRIASTTGTSTAANGLNLTGGCFAKNGVCISFASQARQGISYASTSYLKVVSSGVGINSTYKQIAAPLPGGYYVRYSISASGGGGLCTLVWGIYINDVLRSEELSRVGYTADTQYIYSNQIYAVDSGDLIQLKIRHTTVDDCPVKYSEVFSIEGEVVPTTGAATTTIGFSN